MWDTTLCGARAPQDYIAPMPGALTCFAACAVGLEPLLAGELRGLATERRLEIRARETGGIEFRADFSGLYAANLHLRTASRVAVRMGSFHASAFHELERRARRLPWERYVSPGAAVALRVSSRKSRLYHGDAVAQRLLAAALERVPGARAAPPAAEHDGAEPDVQHIIVRLFHDECTVSADSSGELLHRRGYRLATAKAPLRETLAAALLLASGWEGGAPLLDPMCGSGTIPIEAALLARRVPPGLRRRFAFERWPAFEAGRWRRLLDEATERILPAAPAPILGSDRDEGAVAAAHANAERAGVVSDVVFRRAAISAIEPPELPGWLVTNPPYGVRVGERVKLRNLFAQLGNVARRRCPGWRVAFVSAHKELERQTGISLEARLETLNGGIRVRLVQGTVPRTPAAPA
jgi:putative N6-adenine-specific DNA methylase